MFGTFATQLISGNTAKGGVTNAIKKASAETGVDFNYLMQQANVESGMNPTAKAKTSSATGLYQFIEQTWLRMVKAHGAEHGYGQYANAIQQKSNGDYTVPNRATRNTILNLRKDPQASSLMAAELASDNHDYLQSTVGIEPSKTDLYMAHFLGAGGAANFIKSLNKNPWAPAASMFPEAAHANRSVFYAQGRPLSLQQVYNNFQSRFQDDGSTTPVVQTARADETPSYVQEASNINNDIDDMTSAAVSTSGVNLPDANDWSDPASRVVSRFSSQNRTAGNLSHFYTPVSYTAPAENTVNPLAASRIPGSNLSSPIELQFLKNRMHMEHNDNDRYNA